MTGASRRPRSLVCGAHFAPCVLARLVLGPLHAPGVRVSWRGTPIFRVGPSGARMGRAGLIRGDFR